ncbi:metalloprotease TldD [Methylomagnum ishizawai]|uniref:metalloprotease TldD n=1 Tax=Methylomagnum ishizawai TaxID=1760988 RepID=UPI001C31F196|nr:metalloprotease TldD [Methylomagnum ishizawai]BBL76637.1 protease TldD [Methylomagnum ishizawai]
MQDPIAIAQYTLLEPAGLAEGDLDRVMGHLLGANVDAADVYLQSTRYESWALEDGIVKEGSHSIEQGAGVRAVSGEKTGFAYSDEIALPTLVEAAKNARAIARLGNEGQRAITTVERPPALYLPIDPLQSLPEEEKIALLKRLDQECRQLDPRVEQVFVSLTGCHDVVMVIGQDGAMHGDVRPLVRLNVSVIVEQDGRREQGSCGGGGRTDYREFLEGDRASGYAREAVRQALVNLEAEEAPAGTMTVVLGSGWPGILLHEAIGHGLEGDFNRKGTSAFSGRVGERVASPLCTVVDDGTLPQRRGSLTIDDEGTPSHCTTLIENGILKGYMQDRLNARLMGVAPTGNGRRESYAHLPMPRMTNTYMLPGQHDPEEILRSVKHGLYAKNFGGGQVDITSGKFVFSASEAYLIEDGKITRPVKGATLIGNGPDVLTRVSMVGNDLELDFGVGTCGKDGQSVPVGVGQPTLRVDGLTVGGTRV